MPGESDPIYVRARSVLLDALEALGPHRRAVILGGAQAIYLHVGEGDLAVAPFTSDADVILDPGALGSVPPVEEIMTGAGFRLGGDPGKWIGAGAIQVDLLVPGSVAGSGRRGARLGVHGNRVARKARGLEAALVDKTVMTVEALDPGDPRRCDVAVAGVAALLVAKLHKIHERVGEPGRANDKDALDVLRILRGVHPSDFGFGQILADRLSAEVTREALEYLRNLFGTAGAAGSRMAARAAAPLDDPDTIALSCEALARRLLERLSRPPF